VEIVIRGSATTGVAVVGSLFAPRDYVRLKCLLQLWEAALSERAAGQQSWPGRRGRRDLDILIRRAMACVFQVVQKCIVKTSTSLYARELTSRQERAPCMRAARARAGA